VKWLVDTNVLSELRKADRCDPQVARWAESAAPEALFTSVLVLGEIRRGIERLRRSDPRQAKVLSRWLDQVRLAFAGRILEVTEQIAEEWGRQDVPDPKPVIDGLLAATAKVHGLTLVTRNAADFTPTGVQVLNPFKK
jgi:toxin FitB